jgi:ADP-ribose pyrophosphatase
VSRIGPPIESEEIFAGEVVRLRISRYRRPSGLVVRREVLDHNGAVVMIPVDGDEILLVRQPREATGEFLLELPAGKLEAPDEDRLERAKIELGEEVGMGGRSWRHLGGFYTAPGLITEYIDAYLATDLHPVDTPPIPDEEIEIVRRPLADLPVLVTQIRDAKSLVGLLWLARELDI